MKLTKSELFKRQKELSYYNLMGVMNTSMLMYNTTISINPDYSTFYNKSDKEVLSWGRKAGQMFIDKLHFGKIKWCNGSYGSRWCTVQLEGVSTRVTFYSKELDQLDDISTKYMLVFNPHSKLE